MESLQHITTTELQ